MKLLHLPWLRVVLAYALLLFIFLLYGKFQFSRDPGSIFFDSTRAFERRYSSFREHQAREFINNISSSTSSDYPHARPRPGFCASFLSVRREGDQPLPLSVASSIQGMSPCEREDVFIDVLLAHTNLSAHPSSQLPWITALADSVHGYNTTPEIFLELQRLEAQNDVGSKAVLDYTYALEKCYRTGSALVAIFEDDIVLAESWFVSALKAVADIQQIHRASDQDWLFLRLFNQERSTGWASSVPGQNNELLISLVLIIPTFCALSHLRNRSTIVRQLVDKTSVAIICLVVIPTFVILFFQAGKASMLPPRPGVHKEAFGCCSQGLVFPRTHIPRVVQYLLEKRKGQIDLMLDDLAVEDSLDRYAFYPVQLQHLGQKSVRGTSVKEAQAIWSMAFEELDPQRVHTSHKKLVRQIYGDQCII